MGFTIPKDRSSADYRDLFDNIIDSVCILDSKGNILDVNVPMLELSGYTREELIGKNVKEMLPPDDTEKSKKYFSMLKEHGSYEGYTGTLIDKKGNQKHIEISSKAFYNASGEIIGSRDMIRDITEKKKIESELINSEQKFRTIVTNSEAIIFILDQEGVFTLSEGKGLAALGLKPGEVVGSSVFELYKDSPKIIEAISLALDGTSSKHIVEVGDLFYDTFYSPYICSEGRCQGVIGMAVDITERIRKEKELENARKKAEESDHLKTAFLANLSHEIRTPMNAILGFSALLGDGSLSPEDKKSYLEIVQTKGTELLKMLTDMIDISKIEAGVISLNKEHISLNLLLDEFLIVAQQELVIRERSGVEIKSSFSDEDVIINVDPFKLRQILNNLLTNAIKFTTEGSIEIGFTKDSNQVSIYVKDTGIGIREQQQNIIFDRFRQVDDALNRNAGGTGLGLYISKTLITHMGGEIWVDSSPGEGSTFTFTLPL